MEKNLKKKKNIYIYLNHFAVHQKLIQPCKLTILQFKKKKKFMWNFVKRKPIL